MNIKVISRNVGLALLVSALFMFLSMIVSLCDGRDSAFGPLAISFIITFIFCVCTVIPNVILYAHCERSPLSKALMMFITSKELRARSWTKSVS